MGMLYESNENDLLLALPAVALKSPRLKEFRIDLKEVIELIRAKYALSGENTIITPNVHYYTDDDEIITTAIRFIDATIILTF